MDEQGSVVTRGQGNGAVSRRRFLGMAAGAAVALPATYGGVRAHTASPSRHQGGDAGKPLKFWNMPWGNTYFNKLDQQITEAYKPAHGLPKATYQIVPWASAVAEFASAITSNTGPAVSSGLGTQAFEYASEGYIHYADDLLDEWKSNGLYKDFLPGLLEAMKTKKGYAAIPYNLDIRCVWYSPSLFEQAGAKVPTDWQSYLDACAALKKIGVYGYGTGSGSGNGIGFQAIISFMQNNGGGLFDKDQRPNLLTKENIEAVDFVLECVHKGYVDPASPAYTSSNQNDQWTAKKFGMGYGTAGQGASVGGTVGAAMKVTSPLVGPTGKKGAMYFPNNIMIYKNTPSMKDSKAFLTYYYKKMKVLWEKNTGVGLPPLKSITSTSAFKANPIYVKVIDEWYPICHTWAWPGGESLFLGVLSVDGPTYTNNWAQEVLAGRGSAKSLLQDLQNQIKANWPKGAGPA